MYEALEIIVEFMLKIPTFGLGMFIQVISTNLKFTEIIGQYSSLELKGVSKWPILLCRLPQGLTLVTSIYRK